MEFYQKHRNYVPIDQYGGDIEQTIDRNKITEKSTGQLANLFRNVGLTLEGLYSTKKNIRHWFICICWVVDLFCS